MKETFNKVSNKLKLIGREIFLFLSSRIFLKNFGGVVAFIAIMLFFSFWWMQCYTKHGESLQVHDYTGMSLEDAIDKAQSKSFVIVVNDSTFRPGIEPGIVLAQDPQPLSRVKENRKIYLSITKRIPDTELVPALDGGNDDYQTFDKKCRQKNFRTEIVNRVFSNRLSPNTILEVIYDGDTITNQLNDGVKIPEGSTIGVVVTKRGGGSVPIPELVCKQYDAAAFLVGNYNLNIGSIIPDATVTNQNTAYVWRQVPRYTAGGKMRVGEQVDIYLTQRVPADCSGNSIEAPGTEQPENNDFD